MDIVDIIMMFNYLYGQKIQFNIFTGTSNNVSIESPLIDSLELYM